MLDLLKLMVICVTVLAVVLPIAFLIALSLPHTSDLRQFCFKLCYWGIALLSVGYFAMPIDAIPDVLFPIGYGDDLIALGIGYANIRKAMKAAVTQAQD